MMEYCPDEITGEQLENWMVAQRPVPEPERYVTLKATGSRYAYVNDTQAGKTVKRYDIFRRYGGRDGWTCEIGRAHVRTPVTHAHLGCRPLLETKTHQAQMLSTSNCHILNTKIQHKQH